MLSCWWFLMFNVIAVEYIQFWRKLSKFRRCRWNLQFFLCRGVCLDMVVGHLIMFFVAGTRSQHCLLSPLVATSHACVQLSYWAPLPWATELVGTPHHITWLFTSPHSTHQGNTTSHHQTERPKDGAHKNLGLGIALVGRFAHIL